MPTSLPRLPLVGAVLFTLAAAGGLGGRAAGEESAAKKHGSIAWTESFEKAKKVAAKEKKVVMVDFWATWCGPCKQMLLTTYQDKNVVSRSKQFVPVLIDVDKQQNLAQRYGVQSIPMVVFLDAKGNVLLRSVGYIGAEDLLKLMDEAKKKAKG